MRQARIPLALVAAGLLLLTGCTDGGAQADPEPIIPSSSSAEPSPDEPTESPTEEPPEMPAAASERSYAGAEAFVRHWVDAFNYSTATGDTEPVSDLGLPSCVTCRQTSQLTEEVYANGGRVESDGWTVERVGVNPSEGLDDPSLAVRITRAPERFVRKDPDEIERFSGGRATYAFLLAWQGQRWLVRQIDLLD